MRAGEKSSALSNKNVDLLTYKSIEDSKSNTNLPRPMYNHDPSIHIDKQGERAEGDTETGTAYGMRLGSANKTHPVSSLGADHRR